MEKLELKHLVPYLPYNLKCEVLNSGKEKEIGEMIAVYNDGSACFGNIVESEKGFEYIKPILRPLSDLTDRINPIQHHTYLDGLSFSKIEFVEKAIRNENLFLCDYNYLIEYHFDVFGLIEKGLAISYNDL